MLTVATQQSGFNAAPGMLSGILRGAESIEQIRAASPLPPEAQRIIDTVPVMVGLERLSVIADVLRYGLRYPLPNWLSVPEVDWEKESKVGHAIETMEPIARGEKQLIERTLIRIPVYCTIDDFEFGFRFLATARRVGYNVDLNHAVQAVRRVNERIEESAINGSKISVGGNTVKGLLNAPNANTYTFTGGESWTLKTGPEVIAEIQGLIAKAILANRRGPYHLWVPTTYATHFNNDYVDNYPKTIGARISEMRASRGADGADQFLTWSVADRLPDDTVVLAQMTSDVLDVIYGQAPTILSWPLSNHPMSPVEFAAIACMILRVKDDANNKSGIVIGTKT